MTQPIPADFWDARFGEADLAYGDRASRLLLGFRDLLPATGRALVPGAGQGRDAVFLAECGLDTLAVDLSPVGLERAQELAARRGVTLKTEQADLTEWAWPEGEVDVVAAMFLHAPSPLRPGFHTNMLAALKPGGLIFIEGFTKDQADYQARYNSGGPPVPDLLFAPDDLRADFSAAEPIAFWTGVEHLTEGPYHTGPAALVRAVYRKPE